MRKDISPGRLAAALEFRDALERLDYTQVGFAELIGYGGRSVRAWALGEDRIPQWVCLLLRLMEENRLLRDHIAEEDT